MHIHNYNLIAKMHNFTLTEVGIFKVEWLKFCMTHAMLQFQLGRLIKFFCGWGKDSGWNSLCTKNQFIKPIYKRKEK